MTNYSVKGLSKLAGVTVRTLHHYDEIGLLKPSYRSEKGYRFYTKQELYRLQQILFYRELDFPLEQIKEILDDPDFEMIKALEFHKEALTKKANRFEVLLKTLDKTISEIKNKSKMMTDEELYRGFSSKEEAMAYKKEAIEKWGEQEIREAEDRIKALGSQGWEDVQKKGEEINQMLADLMTMDPAAKQVQETIALHHRHLNTFYEVTAERYEGLGKMYTEDERFTAHYEKYGKGLANFIYEAIKVYCNNGMVVN